MRTLKGIIFLVFVCFSLLVYPGVENESFYSAIDKYCISILGSNSGQTIGDVVKRLFHLYILAAFVRGFYLIKTGEQINPVFEHNNHWRFGGISTRHNYSNIYRVLEFRESRLNTLPQDLASEEFLQSAWLDGAITMQTSRGVHKSLSFLESKLAGMSPCDGYEYIKQ
jgi:hypothetical protein